MYKTTIGIEGMGCSMCEAHIQDVLRRTFDVKKVKASWRKGTCTVTSEQPLDERRLREAIGQTGYTVTSVEMAPYEKHGIFSR